MGEVRSSMETLSHAFTHNLEKLEAATSVAEVLNIEMVWNWYHCVKCIEQLPQTHYILRVNLQKQIKAIIKTHKLTSVQ